MWIVAMLRSVLNFVNLLTLLLLLLSKKHKTFTVKYKQQSITFYFIMKRKKVFLLPFSKNLHDKKMIWKGIKQ